MTDTTFFEELDKLSTGERTALKRSAGTMLAEADGRAIAAFYRCLPYGVNRQEDCWFAAACFHCLWKPDNRPQVKIEEALRVLVKSDDADSKGIDNRVAALLDSSWAEDGYLLTKLNRMIRMLKQKDYCIDCGALLDDLQRWNSDYQTVQRKWVRTMYQKVENTKGE